jgi:hypothetical protein
MSDEMVQIAVYGSKLEAELAKQQLASAGIAALVGSDSAGGMIPSLGVAEGHRLLVLDGEVDDAVAVLQGSGDQAPDADDPGADTTVAGSDD